MHVLYFFPPSDNVISVDNKGPIIRFTEQLKLSIYASCCDVGWEKYLLFSERTSLIAVTALRLQSWESKADREGKLEFTLYKDNLQKHPFAYVVKQKTEKKEKDSCNGVGWCL